MIPFGDTDPEDSWDAGDPAAVMLDNIARRLRVLLGARSPWPSAERAARIDRLFADLATIRERVAGDG